MTRTLPTGDAKARVVREMFDRIAVRYDLLNRLLTFGLDMRWRRRAIRALGLPRGSLVLDLACGTGDLCRELALAGHRPLGADFSAGMLARARTKAPLMQSDILALPMRAATADGAVCAFAMRNVVDLPSLFEETARVTRTGGRIAFLDVSQPRSPFLRLGHRLWFRHAVPFVGGLLSDRDAYRYLPASTAYLPSPDELVRIARGAGFPDARTSGLSGGIVQLLTATRG